MISPIVVTNDSFNSVKTAKTNTKCLVILI